jgi:hypothetical protein
MPNAQFPTPKLNERQIAHRRAMLAHMTQMARRGESRFFLIQGGRGRADYSGNARAANHVLVERHAESGTVRNLDGSTGESLGRDQ